MPVWLWWTIAIALVVGVFGVGGALAWRNAALREFMEAIEDLGWRGALRAVWGLMRDRRVPLFVRLIPVPLVLYLAMPIDIIPDFIPVIGALDDILIVAAALWTLLRFTPVEVVTEHFRMGPAER